MTVAHPGNAVDTGTDTDDEAVYALTADLLAPGGITSTIRSRTRLPESVPL